MHAHEPKDLSVPVSMLISVLIYSFSPLKEHESTPEKKSLTSPTTIDIRMVPGDSRDSTMGRAVPTSGESQRRRAQCRTALPRVGARGRVFARRDRGLVGPLALLGRESAAVFSELGREDLAAGVFANCCERGVRDRG